MKVDLPSFDGKLDIEGFLERIKNVECFFGYMSTPDNKKVKLVVLKLKGGASAWWKQLDTNRRRFGKLPIRTWEEMKKQMRARSLPINYEQVLYNQYQSCRQGSRTIAEYTEEFLRLEARTNLGQWQTTDNTSIVSKKGLSAVEKSYTQGAASSSKGRGEDWCRSKE